MAGQRFVAYYQHENEMGQVKMKKVIALLWLILFCGSAYAMQYPELGVCHNDSVRLREDPGTDGRIIGRADAGTRFIILGEVYVDSQKWYEIDNPTKKGTAYIIARYVNGWYDYGNVPVGEVFANIRLDFGITPQKTLELLGKPSESGPDFMDYSGCKIWHEEGYLSRIEISKRGYSVGGIQVGDKIEKLLTLKMSEDARNVLEDIIHDFHDIASAEHDDDEVINGPEGWTLNSASGESVFFEFGADGINYIVWSCPMGVG